MNVTKPLGLQFSGAYAMKVEMADGRPVAEVGRRTDRVMLKQVACDVLATCMGAEETPILGFRPVQPLSDDRNLVVLNDEKGPHWSVCNDIYWPSLNKPRSADNALVALKAITLEKMKREAEQNPVTVVLEPLDDLSNPNGRFRGHIVFENA